MRQLLRSQLTEGMYVSREVYLDDKYLLLSPEVPISQSLIDRLEAWEVEALYSDGELTEKPASTIITGGGDGVTAPLAAVEEGRKDIRETVEMQKRYRDYLSFAERLFSNFLTSGEIPVGPVQEHVKRMMESMRDYRRYMLRLGEYQAGSTSYVVDHAVKSTIVSLAVGHTMKLASHRQLELGTVAMLHEIGMVRLPSQLYMTDRELTPKEKKAITTHTVLGFKILRQLSYPMSVCLGVLECREHMDGSGYPRGLTGDKLSVNARVVSITSAYAAMASVRPYRAPIDGHNIMLNLLKGRGSRYDETILKALVATMTLFPYGTYVELANGSSAVVADTDSSKPRNPKVRIVTNPSGAIIKDQPIVETEGDDYQIKGVLSAEEIARLRQAF